MHETLWEGVDLKARHADFFLDEMARSLQPPERTQINVAQQASGVILDTQWQRAFYAYLDAFLVMVRSVPDVINACFGSDRYREMKKWFEALAPDERDRRSEFTKALDPDRTAFLKLRLSAARNVTVHRAGYPAVSVCIKGRFGVTHVGTPVKPVPIAESRPAEIGGGMPWLDGRLPVLPNWNDFFIDGSPLFAACREYLTHAGALLVTARGHAQRVHGDASLTPPP